MLPHHKAFDALVVREVPNRYILPRWSVEDVDEDDVGVDSESLQAQKLTSQGKYIVRYSRMCNNFSKIVRPFMGDNEGYGVVSKHMDVMQCELVALKKR